MREHRRNRPPIARLELHGVAGHVERARAAARRGLRLAGRNTVLAGMIVGVVISILAIALVSTHASTLPSSAYERLEIPRPNDVSVPASWRPPHPRDARTE